MSAPKEKKFSTSKVAEILNVSVRTIYRWIEDIEECEVCGAYRDETSYDAIADEENDED